MFISYRFTEVESIKLNQSFNNQEARLVVTEVSISALLGLISSKTIRVDVINLTTDKKIAKQYWDNETLQLATQLKQKHQPTFFQKWGKILLVTTIILAAMAFGISRLVADRKNTISNATENFATCYEPEIKQSWLDGLSTGDFILANKQYDDPAQVFKIQSFTDSTVVLQAFDQFIPLGGYEELDKLNALVLGNTGSNEFVVKLKYFKKGILEDVSDNVGLSNQYIKQIKKK